MRIDESIDRILRSQDIFGEAFYDVFLRQFPEVQEYFHDVDMKRQSLVLTMAVSLIGQHHSRRYPATERYLRYLGTQHKKRGIPRDAYAKWRDAMVQTLQRFHGEEWTEELAAEWQAAFDESIAAVFVGYDEYFTV